MAAAMSAAAVAALGFAPDQQANLPPDIALAYASILTKAPPQSFEQRWSAWGSAYGGANNANGDPATGSNNVRASTFGFAGGMDYHLTPYTVVGFALAGAGTNWGLANAMGGGRSDALQAGAYGISWFGPAYVAGALSFSNHWFTTNRSALGDALTANFVGQGYGARLEGGYRYAVLPAFAVTPYGAVQFQDFNTPAYNETDTTGGGLGLNVAAQNSTDVRTELGARFDDPTVDLQQAAHSVRPPRLGARLCLKSYAERRVSGAAGRHVHGQRRADPAELGADHGRRATFPHAAMDLARQVRRRVRSRLANLRRHRHAAIYVVSGSGIGAPDGPADVACVAHHVNIVR